MTKKEELQANIEAFKQLLSNKDNTTLHEQFKAITDEFSARTIKAHSDTRKGKQNRNSNDLPL